MKRTAYRCFRRELLQHEVELSFLKSLKGQETVEGEGLLFDIPMLSKSGKPLSLVSFRAFQTEPNSLKSALYFPADHSAYQSSPADSAPQAQEGIS